MLQGKVGRSACTTNTLQVNLTRRQISDACHLDLLNFFVKPPVSLYPLGRAGSASKANPSAHRESADVAQCHAGWPDLPGPRSLSAEKPERRLHCGAVGLYSRGAVARCRGECMPARSRWWLLGAILALQKRDGILGWPSCPYVMARCHLLHQPPREECVVLPSWKRA